MGLELHTQLQIFFLIFLPPPQSTGIYNCEPPLFSSKEQFRVPPGGGRVPPLLVHPKFVANHHSNSWQAKHHSSLSFDGSFYRTVSRKTARNWRGPAASLWGANAARGMETFSALLLDRRVIIEGKRQSLGRDHAQGSLSRPREMKAKSDSEGMRGESPAIFLLTFQGIASHADPKMTTRGRRSIKSPQGKAVVSRYQLPRTTRGYGN